MISEKVQQNRRDALEKAKSRARERSSRRSAQKKKTRWLDHQTSNTVSAAQSPLSSHISPARLIDMGIEFSFVGETLDTAALFVSRREGSKVVIVLNRSHVAFSSFETLISDRDQNGPSQAPSTAMQTLLESWALFELSLLGEKQVEFAKQARQNWGLMLERLLSQNGESSNGQ